MSILGNVESGWFASVAHGCRAVSKATLNAMSFGHGWGDRLYANMNEAATAYVEGVNERAMGDAVTNGASRQRAYAAGSAVLERIAQPATADDFARLVGHATGVVGRMVRSGSEAEATPITALGSIVPVVVGVVLLGGVGLAVSSMCEVERT